MIMEDSFETVATMFWVRHQVIVFWALFFCLSTELELVSVHCEKFTFFKWIGPVEGLS